MIQYVHNVFMSSAVDQGRNGLSFALDVQLFITSAKDFSSDWLLSVDFRDLYFAIHSGNLRIN